MIYDNAVPVSSKCIESAGAPEGASTRSAEIVESPRNGVDRRASNCGRTKTPLGVSKTVFNAPRASYALQEVSSKLRQVPRLEPVLRREESA